MRGSQIVGTLFSIEPQFGSNIFVKFPFFHKISILESQNTISRSILTYLSSYLLLSHDSFMTLS